MTLETRERLERALARLVGQRCWSIAAGAGTGSVLHLGLGAAIPRPRPLTNPNLTPQARDNEAEFGLYVECAWRLDGPARVLAGSLDDNRKGGPMLQGLATLQDRQVRGFTLFPPAQDLELDFGEGLYFRAFCDQVSEDEAIDNWSFILPGETFVVGPRGMVRGEKGSGEPEPGT